LKLENRIIPTLRDDIVGLKEHIKYHHNNHNDHNKYSCDNNNVKPKALYFSIAKPAEKLLALNRKHWDMKTK